VDDEKEEGECGCVVELCKREVERRRGRASFRQPSWRGAAYLRDCSGEIALTPTSRAKAGVEHVTRHQSVSLH
jgi:hypothetical protein